MLRESCAASLHVSQALTAAGKQLSSFCRCISRAVNIMPVKLPCSVNHLLPKDEQQKVENCSLSAFWIEAWTSQGPKDSNVPNFIHHCTSQSRRLVSNAVQSRFTQRVNWNLPKSLAAFPFPSLSPLWWSASFRYGLMIKGCLRALYIEDHFYDCCSVWALHKRGF